ncbi:MAG: Gfo/Idh/MocA family protein [Limisphaerales bacterium]
MKHNAIDRRQFLAGAGAALSFTILQPNLIAGTEANRKINLGFIGSGNRSTWISGLFAKHGGYNFYALADYFPEQVDKLGAKLNVPASRQFSGLDGFRRMLELKELDAVVVQSPPYFHPEHAAAAVDAGKHVFVAKPISVDVPGCLSIGESGRKATDNKVVFLVDFQTRSNAAYQEVVKRVQAGAIGNVVSAESTYHCGSTWGRMDAYLRGKPNDPEARLRGWGLDKTLSGDIITEQNIHVLDVAAWFLNAAPLRAYGTGGAKRNFVGDCWDHFAVIFYFPDDVVVSFNSKQLGMGHDDLLCRMYGTSGTVETHYSGKITLRNEGGENFDGDTKGLFAAGSEANIGTFYDNITKGVYSNPSVAPSVRTNLITILGRTAAYRKREVTWEEMMSANEKWSFDLKGLKS